MLFHEYQRLFLAAIDFNISRLPPSVRSIVETYKEALNITYHGYVAPTLRYLASIEIGEDTKQSLGIGLVLGVGTVLMLVIFPGQPRDLYDPKERALRKKGACLTARLG